jgi:hypothetical protein
MRFFLASLTVLLSLTATAQADLRRGLEAFEYGDYATARDELKQIARQGDPRAQYVLGVIYLNGFAAEPDVRAAIDLLAKAAEQGYLQAQMELARIYRSGDGVPQDLAKMAHWYYRAAEQGDVGAQLFIADAYAHGFGVKIDYVQSYMWYEIAIQYWGSLAVRARDVVAEKMTPEQIAAAERLAGQRIRSLSK